MTEHISLHGDDWEFKPFYGMDWLLRNAHQPETRDRRGWLSGGSVPGSVVHDLWRRGDIPDPYVDRNSLLIEWVPQRTWLYRKRFTVPAALEGRRAMLRFEGVDYAAQFFLNGEQLGAHASMVTPVAFDVSDALRPGAENWLVVALEPAPYEQPQVSRTRLVHTHKSRMTYWWDFCPRMVHLGIWDSVALEITGPTRLADVWVRSQLEADYTHAEVTARIALDGDAPVDVEATLRFEGRLIAQARYASAREAVDAAFTLDDPALWWPNGCGDRPLYELTVRLLDPATSAEWDARAVPFGVREIVFVPNDTPDETALPYTPRVNGRPIYIHGWNWVPIDVLYGVERPAKLEHLLTLAQRAHVNMLRVWGGGLIEKEAFYDLCDRLGILIWQEFIQSSSGLDNTPADDPAFVALLAAEARQIVPRKRNHPALAIWGGGNELTAEPERPLDDAHPALGALHDVVTELDPGRMWLPTSPTGRAFSNNLTMIERDPLAQHDVHGPWEHQGLTAQYTLYNAATSLLHSEFGAEGVTHRKTLDATVSAAHQWPVTLDDPVWFHRAAWWVKAERWRESLGEVRTLDALIRGTQYLQAEGVRYAVEANRSRWPHNSGSLPWQFNEPYPMAACTSAVDYYGHPKPLYYAVARAYAPVLAGARVPTQSWTDRATFEAVLWCANALPTAQPRTLIARLVGLDGAVHAEQRAALTLAPGAITPGGDFRAPLASLPELFLLDLALYDEGGAVRERSRTLHTRLPDLSAAFHQPPAQVALRALDSAAGPDRWTITLANAGPSAALYLWLEDARPRGGDGWPLFDDNYLCLLPGEDRAVTAEWRGVPPGERRLTLSGWNVAPMTIAAEGVTDV